MPPTPQLLTPSWAEGLGLPVEVAVEFPSMASECPPKRTFAAQALLRGTLQEDSSARLGGVTRLGGVRIAGPAGGRRCRPPLPA